LLKIPIFQSFYLLVAESRLLLENFLLELEFELLLLLNWPSLSLSAELFAGDLIGLEAEEKRSSRLASFDSVESVPSLLKMSSSLSSTVSPSWNRGDSFRTSFLGEVNNCWKEIFRMKRLNNNTIYETNFSQETKQIYFVQKKIFF
jgi:hypothetical protein